MKCLDEARGRGVEDVDPVRGQLVVGVLDQLVHVLVVLTSVLEKVIYMRKFYFTMS